MSISKLLMYYIPWKTRLNRSTFFKCFPIIWILSFFGFMFLNYNIIGEQDEEIPPIEMIKPLVSNFTRHKSYHGKIKSSPVINVKTCDYDCQRFKEYVDYWPTGKPKAIIYYLTQPRRKKTLIKSLQNLEKAFNSQFNYPVVIFHEKDFEPLKNEISSATNSTIFYQKVQFSVPTYLPKEIPSSINCTSPLSYRHMCRFHAKLVYEYPILHMVDYAWRLDDDSLIQKDISYDVFEFMRSNQLVYGYIWKHFDSKLCTEGLWKATKDYISKNKLKTHFFAEWHDPQIYYNNFEISETKLWTNSSYTKYIDYIDRLGGIFYHRWGDAPIKGIAVSIFVAKQRIHYFKDIEYKHGNFINKQGWKPL